MMDFLITVGMSDDNDLRDRAEVERRSVLKAVGASSLGLFGTGATAGTALGEDSLDVGIDSRVNYTDDVIYQIVTDRFRDGDSSNNPDDDSYSDDCSDLRAHCGGDWQGIIDKIEDGYLTGMGVSALWISPPMENIEAEHPDYGYAYHGYWPRDFKRANPMFGDIDDFQQLIDVAHDNGIKIVIDFVHNHTSPADEDDEEYVEDGVLYDDGDYVAAYNDDPDDLFRRNGGIDDWDDLEEVIYKNMFDLASLDQQNPFVDEYLKDSIEFWLDLGIDGIRVDANRHVSAGWQKTMMDTIFDHQPVFTFGEWFLGEDETDEDYYDFSNETGMSQLDFRYGQQIRQVLMDFEDDWHGFWEMIEETRAEHKQVLDQVPFLDNHDKERFTLEDADDVYTDIALAVLLTSRGVPKVYYGTEQYMVGEGDPESRAKMESFDTDTDAYNVISSLADLRASNDALAYGEMDDLWIEEDVLIFERTFGNSTVVVAVNRSDEEWYEITNLETSLPGGTYSDELDEVIEGWELEVNDDGSVDDFSFGPQTAAVWAHDGSTDAPTLGHVGPIMGQVGHTIEVSGTGFGDDEGTVLFDDDEAEIVSWSDTKIEADVPFVEGGYYDVSVVDANGAESNAFEEFDVLSDELVPVRFVVENAETDLGENVHLVGDVHELGDWDPEESVGPFFNDIEHEYPDWYYDVAVPADREIEFKFVIVDEDGEVTWESGDNRTYMTPSDTTDTYVGEWQD